MDRPVSARAKRNHLILYIAIPVMLFAGIVWMISIQAQTLGGEIELAEVAKNLGPDPYNNVVIDTRPTDQWRAGHVKDSQSIPLEQLGRRFSELAGAKDRQIIVIDDDVEREKKGAALLTQAGFRTVLTAKGGIGDWRAQNRALVTDNDSVIHKLVQ